MAMEGMANRLEEIRSQSRAGSRAGTPARDVATPATPKAEMVNAEHMHTAQATMHGSSVMPATQQSNKT